MDAQTVRDFLELITAVRGTMDEYLLGGELHGVACAAGSLAARINNLKVIVAAYDDREPNAKDRFELSSLASTIGWLAKEDFIARDFNGITVSLPQTAFAVAHPEIAPSGDMTYRDLMSMLHKGLVDVVLEGQPVPLSA